MNFLKKAASLLVETPAATNNFNADWPLELDDERKSVEPIAPESAEPDSDQILIDEAQIETKSTLFSGDSLDFAAVYRAANVPTAPFSAEQMLETLSSLPAELPLETKRATVHAMLSTLGKTLGATPESVIGDASRKLAALGSFARYMEQKSGEVIAQNEAEIAALQAQIEEKRAQIQNTQSELARVLQNCEAQSKQFDDVLEFFSLG